MLHRILLHVRIHYFISVVKMNKYFVIYFFLRPAKKKSTGHHLSNALHVQTRLFRENRLTYCELNDADSRVEEFQQRRLDINRRRPPTLFNQNSWTQARAGINDGESSYLVDRVSQPSSTS